MNNATKFEDRASSSPSTHEGETSKSLYDRLSRTRDTSQRQLPTDQDYAVSTREYQTDQSSLKPAPTAAGPLLEKRQKQLQRPKQPHRFAGVDGVTPYQRLVPLSRIAEVMYWLKLTGNVFIESFRLKLQSTIGQSKLHFGAQWNLEPSNSIKDSLSHTSGPSNYEGHDPQALIGGLNRHLIQINPLQLQMGIKGQTADLPRLDRADRLLPKLIFNVISRT